ncbi:MAG TPA: hypothetical protein VN279_16980 [Rhodocyclaceae bacterium]|jgi:hypothetical protein|nr:hypothetical protein [Rhodocyclaceae bacterium]
MNDPNRKKQDGDLRRRLKELLAVPERDRTDAQWDELAELELQLAPGNRIESARRADAPAIPQPARAPSRGHGPSQRPPGKKSRKPKR